MNADAIPEEPNNSKPPESEESTSPLTDASETRITSSTEESTVTPDAEQPEDLITKDADSPEKVPIIEEDASLPEIKLESQPLPPANQTLEADASSIPEIKLESQPFPPGNQTLEADSESEGEIKLESQPFPRSNQTLDGDSESEGEIKLESEPFPRSNQTLEADASSIPEIKLESQPFPPGNQTLDGDSESEAEIKLESQPFPPGNQTLDGDASSIPEIKLESQPFPPGNQTEEKDEESKGRGQEIENNISSLSSLSSSSPPPPMRIFITGASGCIGHYIVETLIEKTDYELYLLVRNPDKLRFDYNARPGIHIVRGDMREIKRFGKLLKTINCAILIATAWGGQEAIDVNVFKTIELLNLLNPKVCQQIVYFSTASVLNRNNEMLKEAGQAGTDYIRSKYDFLRQVSRVSISKRMTVLFPTLVLGGDDKHPYSHVSGGLPDLIKKTEIIRWFDKPLLKVKPIDVIRFFKADGSFHFIHAQDIATVVRYLVDNPPESQEDRWMVLGNAPVTLNQIVEEACAYLNKPITRQFDLSPWLANVFIRLFRIQMSAWDRFSFNYRHFTYENTVNPSTFGMPVYCPTFIDVLKLSGITRRG